uniref:NBS-LRR disease resistance protein n=1 Tax=Dasypyrum villosum TaxID=40247 RepID=A0A8K1IBC3_9POAL|nr:NBS-LRR disease resistance protein [Dasypyrum villosum]
MVAGAAELVVNLLVQPLVTVVLEKASNYLLNKYKVMKGMEEQHEILKRRLPAILDVIADAEQVAVHREGAAAWLQAIKKVTYQANEVFDEFKYEALRRKAKKEGHYKELGFDVVKLFPTHNRFIFRNRMGRKLDKIVRAIDVLVTEMNAFGFKYQQQPPRAYNQWRQKDHDIIDPEKITSRSRAEYKNKIVDILVGQAKNADLTVIPIVGMGNHFNVLLWVCVSDSFDVDALAVSIVQAAPKKKQKKKKKKKNDGKEVDALADSIVKADPNKKKKNGKEVAASNQDKTPLDILQNVVSGQRYLLVLDDIWTRDVEKWEQLKACLEHGGMGSVVLTTTRDKGVAKIMGTVEAHNLRALRGQYIKEIIETMSFSCLKKGEERPAVLVNMVDELVERCAGSPLAARALGYILCNKTSEEEWKDVSSRSNIFSMESGILPILKLSYNDLPPHMKQCFAFCGMFPKGYEIDVDKLIQLWIAHGFIIQEKDVRLETIGKKIFDELVSRSFFQDVKPVQATASEIEHEGACYSRTTCKLHDLMHDVALSVMDKECVLATEEPGKIDVVVTTKEPRQSEWLPETTRHLFLSCKEPGKKLNGSLGNSSPAIQTLMCDSHMENSSLQHLSKYSSLRALKLPLRGSFPLKPKHLHHLRYLDLSRSHMKALPEDISILYNLQTLNLSGCESLRGLPREMKYMTALRHLYTHGCPSLESMPRGLEELTALQTLTCFVAGSDSNCSNVGQLRSLNLGGQLELCHLENVKKEDAKDANLVKKELRELTLKWAVGSENVVDEYSSRADASLLEELKPHDGLHAIRIHSYGATTFSTWMAMLRNIVEIHLFHCNKLQWLFSRDRDTSLAFPNLKELTLEGLACFGEMKLRISHCAKLTALPGQPTFPNLQDVCIKNCPQLTTTAKSPKLSVLNMKGHEAEMFLWLARHVASLTNLKLQSLEESRETTTSAAERSFSEVVDGKEKWNGHDFPLTVLVLKDLKSGVTELCACSVHLQELSIWRCHVLVHWPEKEFQGLVSLRKLMIHECNNLIGYAQAPAKPSNLSENRQLLPHLKYLIIECCSSLIEVFNVPATLRRMEITGCCNLKSIYGRRLHQGQSALSIHQGSSSILEVLPSSSLEARAEHLEKLELSCGGLTSLECRSGELPSLECLYLWSCSNLSSLPDGQQAYSSLRYLGIRKCHGLKTLPASLHQLLGSLQEVDIDAHYYGSKHTTTTFSVT